jgi:cell division inhibitor SulA
MHAQQLEQSDVELVYVLVGGSASSDWLHDAGLKYIKITDLQDLQPAILDQIKTLLI